MPDLEISNLPELTGAALAATDPFAVADLSASETKRITAKNLVQSGLGLVDDASIPAAKVAALGATQLASNSVTTAKIADSAVSTAKIADAGVTDAKLATGLSGAKLSNASVTATKLGAVTDRGLDQTGGKVGHTNSLTAGTASGISFDAQGHVTAATSIPAADLPAGTTAAIGGVSVPSGSGLTVSASGALDHQSSITAGATANIAYDEHGHILSIEAIDTDDLPVATTVAKGAVSVPVSGKLEVSATGVLSLSNTAVTPGVHSKVTVDAQGRVTSGTGLDAADIPDLAVDKLTTGQLPTVRIADDAVTAAKLADRSTATIAQTTPTNGAFIGQTHLNSITGDYFLWDGNVWQPIGISVGEIVLAGTYNATTNKVATVTSEGTALGFVVGSALPSAASANKGYYVVVSTSGTGSAPAPVVALNPPDFLLSTGLLYTEIDVSSTVTAQQASNIAFTASGSIASTNVQSAIEELDTEKAPSANPTLTGTVTLDTAVTLVFEGTTANGFETTLTVVDPTADRTIALPNTSGTVVSTGDTGTVTSAMIADATIVNADVSASAAIAGTKISPNFGSQSIATTGVINAGSGTAAAPSVSVGTADNGLYSSGTDEIGVSTNGVQRLKVNSSGNVGIGTASPGRHLTVSGGAAEGAIQISNNTSGTAAGNGFELIHFPTGETQLLNRENGAMRFDTNNTERLRIDNSGKVGIGTSSPSSPLHVSATNNSGWVAQLVNTGTGTDANGLLVQASDSSTEYAFKIVQDDGTNLLAVKGNGNVGIGTAGPLVKLDVVDSAAMSAIFRQSSGNQTSVYIEHDDSSGRIGTSYAAGGGAYKPLVFETSNSERLRIDNSGRVGIGESSPSMRLDVKGTVSAGSGSDEDLQQWNIGSNNVKAEIKYVDAAASRGMLFGTSTAHNLAFQTNNTERMQIGSSGNIGIGISSSSDKLTVAGSINLPNVNTFIKGGGHNVLQVDATRTYFYGGTNGVQIRNADNSAAIVTVNNVGAATFAADATINTLTVGRGSGNVNGNTAIGLLVLDANTSGSSNTGVGAQALDANTTGSGNAAFGTGSLQQSTTGNYNTAIGRSALFSNTSGLYNSALGFEALKANTTATGSVGLGFKALMSNTTGNYNTAAGYAALHSNTTGTLNTATGSDALYYNTTGADNVASGYKALYSNTTGYVNVAIGEQSLYSNITGKGNVALGYKALGDSTGSGNIGIGFVLSNAVYSPVFNPTTESNRLVLGHTGITNAYVKVAWTVTSDERDKMNFAPVPYGLDFVNQLKPTAYQFKVDRDTETPNGDVRYGFKAQDILALEGDNPVIIDTEDADHLKYKGEHLVPVLVNAVQELTAMVKELQAKIKTLKG